MEYKNYKEELKNNLPPNLDAGTTLSKVVRVEKSDFQLNGKETEGMRVFSIENGVEKEYRTSSGVLMKQFNEYFEKHKEPLENVKIVSPRGKQYLTLESA
jgi:hypothetical protein